MPTKKKLPTLWDGWEWPTEEGLALQQEHQCCVDVRLVPYRKKGQRTVLMVHVEAWKWGERATQRVALAEAYDEWPNRNHRKLESLVCSVIHQVWTKLDESRKQSPVQQGLL